MTMDVLTWLSAPALVAGATRLSFAECFGFATGIWHERYVGCSLPALDRTSKFLPSRLGSRGYRTAAVAGTSELQLDT